MDQVHGSRVQMIQALGLLITMICMTSLAWLIEEATGVYEWTKHWLVATLSPSSPLTGGERGEGGEEPEPPTEED